MRMISTATTAGLCAAAVFLAAAGAPGADLKVGIVDMARVFNAYPETKTANEAIDKQVQEFEGERNVFAARTEALEKMNKDLSDQSAKLSKQLEAAYQKVQEIAEKAIEGCSQAKSLADLQKLLAEQGRKTSAEKA